MADFESRIRIGIDNSQALEAIKALQREISVFQTSMARGTAAQQAAASKYQQELVSSINATGKFSANIRSIQTTTESFTNALEKNKLSFGQYFRYAAASTKTFGRSFQNELEVINKTARERVKDLQTQYVKLGRDASGAMQAIAIRPLALDLDNYATKTAIAAQKQQILNQLLKQGSTNLLNFGKNTQWAGRQLMVGFTIPLSIFGTTAARSFMKLEEQAIKFKKVYGDLFTTGTEREEALKAIRDLADGFTQYGVAVSDTIGIAAEAAAAGFKSIDLQRQTEQAIRLSVLGQLEQQKALETTISLQNAFQMSSENLAESINFLNAVENQTVVSLDDITTAVPKVAPVIQSLGGDVKDLAFFLAAMKEGGVNASEGANALKSGLASLINPTDKASQMLAGFGINIRDIITRNAGDLKKTVLDFALALDALDPLTRAQAIEQLFGKFQFARLSTLFDNVIRDGSQAARVLDLATASAGELANMAETELGLTSASAMNKFKKAAEDLQAALAPVGELFLEIVTPLINFATDVVKNFNNLDEGIKKFVGGITGLLGVIGPVAIMTFGLLANGVANIIKGFLSVRKIFQGVGKTSVTLGEQTEYMTQKQLEELAVAASLEQAHMNLAQAFTSEVSAIDKLVAAYDRIISRQRQFAAPGMATTLGRAQEARKMKDGGVVTVQGPRGAGDVVPAMLSPGEAVIPSKMAQRYAPLIEGMIAGNIPGFSKGVLLGMPRSGKGTSKDREAAEQIYENFKRSRYANVEPRNYGHQLAKTTGHSFPIFGLGGVYMSPEGKKVFVKPVLDETAAVAEMRATQITRQAHGLKAPEQKIVVMRDPTDVKRQRKFLALESDLDATFVNNDPMAVFNEDQYFKQLVASLLRVDKDLSASNVFKDVVADVGPAGVFSRASGQRDYADSLPSMEQQAMINLLGIKGGAKRAFAESTLGLMSKLTPQQYHQRMIAEIQQVLPLLKQTVASFGLTDPREVKVYSDMIQRLEAGLGVDWSKFHAIHSAVKIPKNKQSSIPGYANGVVSVPGPKGKGDVVPAMLSPGEAVIPTEMAKKYAPLIQAIIAGNIPGFQEGTLGAAKKQYAKEIQLFPELELAIESLTGELEQSGKSQSRIFKDLRTELEPLLKMLKTIKAANPEGGAKASSFIGTNLSHGGPKLVLTKEQANDLGQQLIASGKTGRTSQFLANAQGPVNAKSNLVFPLPRAFNDPAGDMTGVEISQWIREDKQRFMSFIYQNYGKQAGLDPSDPELMLFADNIANNLQRAGARAVKDPEFYTIIENGISDMLKAGKLRVARLLEDARDDIASIDVKGRPEPMQAGTRIAASGKRKLEDGISFAADRVSLDRSVASGGYSGLRRSKQSIESKALFDTQSDEFIVRILRERVRNILERGLGISSPSKEYQNITNAVTSGVRSGTDDAAAAGTDIGKTIATSAEAGAQSQSRAYRIGGGRRVTTDREIALASAARLFRPQNDATAIFREQLNPVVQQTKTNFDSINGTILQTSFAFSSIASLASMFGSELGGATQIIYGLSSALMALTAIVEIARVTELKRIAINKAGGILELIRGVPGKAVSKVADAKAAASVTKIFEGGIRNSFQNLVNVAGKLGGTFGKIAQGFIRFLPVLGAVITAFTVFQMISEAQDNQRKKIEGLGNAANLTADQLKYLADATGTQIQNLGFGEGYRPGGATGVNVSEEAKGSIQALREDSEEFKKQFEDVLYAISNSAPEAAQAALANLALQLDAKGFAPDIIAGIIEELKKESGRKELDLGFIKINVEGKLDIQSLKDKAAEAFAIVQKEVQAYNEKQTGQNIFSFGTTPPQAAGKTYASTGGYAMGAGPQTVAQDASVLSAVNLAASAATSQIENLNSQFTSGLMTVAQYNSEFDAVLAGVQSLDPAIRGLAIDEMAAKFPEFADQLSKVSDQGDKLLLLEAQVKGVRFDDTDIQELIKNGPNASTIRQRLTKETNEAAYASEQARKAEEARAKATQAGLDLQGFDEEIERNRQIIEDAPKLVEAGLSEKDAIDALTDSKWNNIFATAKQKDLEEGTTKYTQEAINAYNSYKDSVEGVNNAVASGNLADQITQLQQQNNVLAWLTQNGMSTANALEVIGNATYYAAAQAALANGTYSEFADQLNQIKTLSAPLSPGGSGQKSDFQQAIENLRDQKKEAMNLSITYTKLRNAKLSANQAFAAAQDPIIAAAVATTKVGTKQWTQLVSLIKQADGALKRSKLVEAFAEKQAGNALLTAFTKITPMLSKFGLSLSEIESILNDPNIARALFDDLKDGKINSQQILDFINQIPDNKRIKLAFDMATPEGMMGVFDEAFSKQMAYFDLQERQIERSFKAQEDAAQAAVEAAQEKIDTIQEGIQAIETRIEEKQRQIELTVTRPIEALNNAIDSIEREIELNFNRPIATLQEESSDLSNELELIDRRAEEINKGFDAQAASLEKVNELSAEAAEQDRARLDIAQALASGNVADAITAMRKARQDEQARAREKASKAIQVARENELAKIRSASGLTREQIEQRQFEISQQIFNLEEQREARQQQIQVIQDQIYGIEQNRRKILDEIRVLEDQIYTTTNTQLKDAEAALKTANDNLKTIQDSKQAKLDEITAQKAEWELLRDQADEAMFKSNGYLTSLTNAKNMVEQIKKAWEAVGTVTPGAVANIIPSANTGSTGGTGNAGSGGGGGNKKENPAYAAAKAAFDLAQKNLTNWTNGRASLLAQISRVTSQMNAAPPLARPALQKQIDALNKDLTIKYNSSDRSKLAAAVTAAQTKLSQTPQYLAGGGMIKRFAAGGKIGYYPMGGLIPYKAQGGMFKSINTDTVPAMLTPGEFVVKRFAVEKFGEGNLKAINNGTFKGNSVYNYEVNVNVKSEANPDQIARAVMTQIKQVDAQRIRGNRF